LDITIDTKRPQIPGISEFVDKVIPTGLLLLIGPAGAGKSMYCRQFLADGLLDGDSCLLISSTLTKKQSKDLFSGIEPKLVRNLKFVNPYTGSSSKTDLAKKLSATLKEIRTTIDKDAKKGKSVRIVIDPLTHLLLLCDEKAVLKFMTDLSLLLKDGHAMAICTLAVPDLRLQNALSTIAGGIIEMKIEDNHAALERSIRLLSIKGLHHEPSWVKFKIHDDGQLVFEGRTNSVQLNCTLCGRAISGTPFTEGDFFFDTRTCMATYGKLARAYGPSISETGLPSEAFNVSFFFIDIVGLSDPSLSIRKQIQKIETLNRLLASCEAFKTSTGKKIILPTGDGMAIGFLLKPELPLELSIQLHKSIRSYNRGTSDEDKIGVRIGLGSGPVFTVTDMNNIQNVWGPGIILARRVMDAGDNGHILLAENLAGELIALKDEYREIIKPICQAYEIKHGQKIKLYSAYSQDFGNPDLPARVPRMY
jgi:KaiC/GvpD/RAD55 family RecA-like ATPase/class 3 adenylate cyclase